MEIVAYRKEYYAQLKELLEGEGLSESNMGFTKCTTFCYVTDVLNQKVLGFYTQRNELDIASITLAHFCVRKTYRHTKVTFHLWEHFIEHLDIPRTFNVALLKTDKISLTILRKRCDISGDMHYYQDKRHYFYLMVFREKE